MRSSSVSFALLLATGIWFVAGVVFPSSVFFSFGAGILCLAAIPIAGFYWSWASSGSAGASRWLQITRLPEPQFPDSGSLDAQVANLGRRWWTSRRTTSRRVIHYTPIISAAAPAPRRAPRRSRRARRFGATRKLAADPSPDGDPDLDLSCPPPLCEGGAA